MRRRDFIPGLGASVAPTAWLSAAPAQRRPMQVIGYVSTITPEADAELLNAFRQALRRDRLCRVACVDPTSSSPLLGLAVTYPENRSVRSLLSVWASTAPWLVSRTLPESLRPDCDLSRRSIIVPAICGGHRDAQRQRLRVARRVIRRFRGKNWLARERCPSKRRTVARRQHHAVLRLQIRWRRTAQKGNRNAIHHAPPFARTTISCAPNRKAMNRGR
jgi:hypothetical protein